MRLREPRPNLSRVCMAVPRSPARSRPQRRCWNRAGHDWWLGRFKGYRIFGSEGPQLLEPADIYPAGGISPRPRDRLAQTMGWRPGRDLPSCGFQGEGLLAVTAPGEPSASGTRRILVQRLRQTLARSLRRDLVHALPDQSCGRNARSSGPYSRSQSRCWRQCGRCRSTSAQNRREWFGTRRWQSSCTTT